MNIYLRSVFALISAAIAYGLYILVPSQIFDLLDTGLSYLTFVTVEIGDYDQLEFYIKSVGFMIIGVTFAHKIAADKSKIKAVWRLCRLFLKIIFWGLFLFADFNTIDLSASILSASSLLVNVDLQKVFWFAMGGVILDIVITVLDFLIAFIPEKTKEDK
ncbi:MAG: hypothetical protein ACTSVZ_13695 [Promethearchaeota archaeon]